MFLKKLMFFKKLWGIFEKTWMTDGRFRGVSHNEKEHKTPYQCLLSK